MVNKKAPRSKKQRKWLRHKLLYCGGAILLLVAIGGTYALAHHHQDNIATQTSKSKTSSPKVNPPNTIDYTRPSSSDPQISDQAKGGAANNNGSSSTPASPTSIDVTITRAANSGSSVVVSSLVTGTTSGVCTLTATQTSQTSVVLTNAVALEANSYACPNFTIPYSQFPNGGDWQFKLTLTSGSQTANNTWAGGAITVNK